jgi:hypothetical protein
MLSEGGLCSLAVSGEGKSEDRAAGLASDELNTLASIYRAPTAALRPLNDLQPAGPKVSC